ncbi:MAG: TonB-dependent receptor, partial [Desulfobacterales bacterium]|nr:TonB-dependent receptor [Desulfobacterales bacterium]
DPEQDAEYTPEHKFTLDARYYFDFGMTLSFQGIYTGDQVEYDGSTPTTVGDYFVANFKVNQKWKITDKLTSDIFLEVSNLFDEDYYLGHGPEPGRNFLVGATLSF